MTAGSLSIVVPTYGRDDVLVRTLELLLALEPPADEILVVDQSPDHLASTRERLEQWDAEGSIRWLRLRQPSIPRAMNVGLRRATGDRVLYVDDDVDPRSDLVQAHLVAGGSDPVVVAGQVLQPGEVPEPLSGRQFAFNSSVAQDVDEVIGCNFSVGREAALGIGGFDENYVGAAYRYEADFCLRAKQAGMRIVFEPAASLRHLREPRGGTRARGTHLVTSRPDHSVGEYYFLLTHQPQRRLPAVAARLLRSWSTRFHLRHPWVIPKTLLAEIRGLVLARRLRRSGPKLLTSVDAEQALPGEAS